MLQKIRNMGWELPILGSLTLGLAPFNPPHLWEKLNMLAAGTLSEPLDIFDLLMHAAFPLLLLTKVVLTFAMPASSDKEQN